MNKQFEISGEFIELNKLLKASGLCDTGGQAKQLVEEGQIFVDGEKETRIRRKIRDGMMVKFGENTITVAGKTH